MEPTQVRAGRVEHGVPAMRVVAFFPNSSMGNSAIQLLGGMGIPSDRLGVTPPELLATKQGMVLSIPCVSTALAARVEAACRSGGATVSRQPADGSGPAGPPSPSS